MNKAQIKKYKNILNVRRPSLCNSNKYKGAYRTKGTRI